MKNRNAWGSYFGITHNFWYWKQEKNVQGTEQDFLLETRLQSLTWHFFTPCLHFGKMVTHLAGCPIALPGGIPEEPRARIHRTSPLFKIFSWTPQCRNTQLLHLAHLNKTANITSHDTSEERTSDYCLITLSLNYFFFTWFPCISPSILDGRDQVCQSTQSQKFPRSFLQIFQVHIGKI